MTKNFPNEKDVKKEIKALLDKHEWFWWCPPANGFGVSGISDFQALRHGVFMAIEAKHTKTSRKPSERQLAYLRTVSSHSAFAFVVNEANMGWFAVWLQAFDDASLAKQKGGEPTPETGAALINAIKALTVDAGL